MTAVPAILATPASAFDVGRIPVPVLVALAAAVAGRLLLLAVLAAATRPRLRGAAPPAELTPYERRVYDRVAGLAVGGVQPAAAPPRGSKAQAARSWRGFRREVIRDAQRRGCGC